MTQSLPQDSSQGSIPCLRCGDFCGQQAALLDINICEKCLDGSNWDLQSRPYFPWSAAKAIAPWLILPIILGTFLGLILTPQVFSSPDWTDTVFFTAEVALLTTLAFGLCFPGTFNLGTQKWKPEVLRHLGLTESQAIPYELITTFPSEVNRATSFPGKNTAILLRSSKAMVILGSPEQTLSLPYSRVVSVKSRVTRPIPYYLIITIDYLDSKGLKKGISVIYFDKVSVKENLSISQEWIDAIQSQIDHNTQMSAHSEPSE